MLRFEALNAKHGDAFLLQFGKGTIRRLWIIDGGPRGTWKHLRRRLEDIKGEAEELTVDLAMLSHVDDDHVAGVLDMMKSITSTGKAAAKYLDIRRFWHNSFSDLVGSEAEMQRATASLTAIKQKVTAALSNAQPELRVDGGMLDGRAIAVFASIDQGRELRDYLEQLKLSGNDPFGGTISSKSGRKPVNEATVTVLGPIAERLEAFRTEWKKTVARGASIASLFRDDLDESPTNLSSLVLLVEIDGKKILLTGDARGDDIVKGFKVAMPHAQLPMKLDILKMPHHGSDRNMTEAFLKAFPADHYVISADGKYGNPDADTVKAIVQTRPKDKYTIHFTNTVAELPELMEKLSRGKQFAYEFGKGDAPAFAIELR